MHRFYLAPEQCSGPEIFLGGREAHHALHVLRLRDGEEVTVLDGVGNVFSAQIVAHDRDKLRLKVLRIDRSPAPVCKITLIQALPRGKIIESIIQKSTELGVGRIVPLLSERVVTELNDKRSGRKTEKWQAIAIEAIKQCGSAWLPIVEAPVSPAAFLARNEKPELSLVGSLQSNSRHPQEYFSQFREAHRRSPGSIYLWIGPEGDFSLPEIQSIEAAGALPISLGPRVLRVETAAIYCLSFLDYELRRPDIK